MSDPSGRLLRLLSLLQATPTWTGTQLADRLGVTTRTIRNDIARLRDLGYPVEATPGVAGGYRMGPGAQMPPLLLDDDEAVAVAVGLGSAASHGVAGIEETSLRALVKLEQVLPNRLRRRVQAVQSQVEQIGWGSARDLVDADILAIVSQACRDREQIRFDYADRKGAHTARLVEPHRLVAGNRRWYLAAWDARREDWRTFRLDRADRVRLAGVRFAPREPPTGNAAEYVRESIRSMDYRYHAAVVLHAPAAKVRELVPPGAVEEVSDRACRIRMEADNLEWLAMRVAMIGEDFEIESPPELREAMARIGARITRATAAR
ncbi:MAG: YafY family transcriptional regulator [Actinobacteria bacterium]|nr:YafY family transcriptional regulator [Actinomycetota bacterium]